MLKSAASPILASALVALLGACGDSSTELDLGNPPRDAGFINLIDASRPDTGRPDLGFDAGVAPDVGPTPDLGDPTDAGSPDATADAGMQSDAGSPADLGVVTQTGELLITEIRLVGTGADWVEVENRSGGAIDLTTLVLRVASKSSLGDLAIYAPSDAAGGAGTPVTLAPGERAVGAPNPPSPSPPPAFATFIFGAAGALGNDAFADSGDVIEIGPGASVYDRLSITSMASTPGQAVAATEFPVVSEIASALDPGALAGGALGNDDPAAWCVPVFRGHTPGAVNGSCSAFLISEALIDFASIGSGVDTNNVFVEIGGPAGGSLAGLVLSDVRGTDGVVSLNAQISGARMPLDGLYVVARGTSGVTNIPNADQIGTFDPRNSDGAIQLVRTAPNLELLDVLAHGTISVGVDQTRGLSLVASDPLPDLNTRRFSVTWARSDDLAFTGENRLDFRHDPSPTPGERNGVDAFALQRIEPANAVATATVGLVFEGVDFTDFMSLQVGSVTRAVDGTNSGCTFLSPTRFRCNFARPNPAASSRVDVQLTRRPEAPGSELRTGGFTWTMPNNETNSASELQFCNLQFPAQTTTSVGVASEVIYGRVYHAGLTEAAGPHAAVLAELGYGPFGTDPRNSNAWVWSAATYNVQSGNDDEYQGTLTADRAGSYAYTFRFSIDDGLTHTYADSDGAGTDPGLDFDPALPGTLTAQ